EPDLLFVKQDDDMIQKESLDKNQIIEQGLIHELYVLILPEEVPDGQDNIKIISFYVSLKNLISGSAQHLSYLFETAIKSNQQEILDWYNYFFEFESKVDALIADGRIKDKTKTHRAKKHLMSFGKNGIGLDKIKLVLYNVTEILKLTNPQIQNVIDQVKKYTSDYQSHMTLIKTVPSRNDQIKAESESE
ncbi:5044_t:CDS:2, partial [Funneliformis mosseae]